MDVVGAIVLIVTVISIAVAVAIVVRRKPDDGVDRQAAQRREGGRAVPPAGEPSASDSWQDKFVWAAITATIGEQLKAQPFPTAAAAASQAYIVLVVAACIGYKFPSKVAAVYLQEFGTDGPSVHGKMVDAIDKWADRHSSGRPTIPDLPILKGVETPDVVSAPDVLKWAVPAFRYGIVLGASFPDLFRDLWENTKRDEQGLFHGLQQTGVPVPEDVVAAAKSDFDGMVEETAGFLPVYESKMGALPTT